MIGLLLTWSLAALAETKNCHFDKCEITGHSNSSGISTYSLQCKDQYFEFIQDSLTAQNLDLTTRKELAKCNVQKSELAPLIKAYGAKVQEIENPKCYLTQWKGQMMIVAEGVKGRCSFKMNKVKVDEFRKKTGASPLYQCEGEYFIIVGEQTAAAIYKKSGNGWTMACRASIRVGEKVDTIDWQNPPKYYVPEGAE